MKKIYVAFITGLVLPCFICAQSNTQQPFYPGSGHQKNYSIIPKLPAAPKPEPIEVTTIPLPTNVSDAVLVNYLHDGIHLIMEVHMVGKKKSDLAVMKDNGTDFKCLTCNLPQEIGDEMPVPLPGDRRVYTPRGILECTPSIVNCQKAQILPLIYPAIPGGKILMRIASNMSPDGIHVAGTLVTTKGALVLVSELTRFADEKGERYELTNAKVVAGDKVAENPSDFRPLVTGAGEVKSFADGGRSLINSSVFESSNFDLAKINLATGDITRVTKHFSYDEGTYPSPDGKWIIVQTHRQTTRMDVFGLIPRPLFAGLPQTAGVANQRNAEYEGFLPVRRFYGLTMIDKYGDRARLPEEGYTGQPLTVANDDYVSYTHYGNFTWEPGSTHGVFWEQLDPKKQREGSQAGSLRMIRFTSRKPTKALLPFTPDMKWATNLKDIQWPSPTASPETGSIKGAISGYAEITTKKAAPGSSGEPRMVTKYFNFSDDGIYILNGTESTTLAGYPHEVSWDADIEVTGKRKGYLKAQQVTFSMTGKSSGTMQAKLGDHEVSVDLSKGLPTGVPGELR